MSASAPAAAGKDRQQDDLASRLADAIRVGESPTSCMTLPSDAER